MDNDTKKPPEELESAQPRVESAESKADASSTALADANKDNMKKLMMLLAALILLVAGAAAGIFLASDSDDEPNAATNLQEESSDQNEATTDASALTLADIEQSVMSGGEVWTSNLDGVLEAYDGQNDNVSYSFGDTSIDVTSNGLPDHETGEFPNPNNPNTISEQDVSFSVPRSPAYSGSATPIRTFGYTLGGIKIEPGTAERDSETNAPIEAFNTGVFDPGVDENNAHVQPTGAYHYHGLPSVLVTTGEEHSNLVGFAVDGFPIYGDHGYRDGADANSPVDHMTSSWRLKSGERPDGEPSGTYNGDYTTDFEYVEGTGDLDECNGRFTVTPEFPEGTYAYFITETFPFFGRCVMGEVIDGIDAGGGGTPQGAPQGSLPPR